MPLPLPAISFTTPGHDLGELFHRALDGLYANVRTVHGYDALIEGAEYAGIWLECGPHEATLFAQLDPSALEVAANSHRIFFAHQREDGYIPCFLRFDQIGTGQIQMVRPIARTAIEVYLAAQDKDFLETAYHACSRWDQWLGKYRDTRGTGLCEGFCQYDTGHDNSPRWKHLPHACPDLDARICPDVPGAPYIAPDLSASRIGGQLALSNMARLLGREEEVDQWLDRARADNLLSLCFHREDACFYDLDSKGQHVRLRGDALTRVLDEGIVDGEIFDQIYQRHIRNPGAFWTPHPLPSIAVDDPQFVKELPHNSWGGATQALTAMRAPRWFLRHHKFADLSHLQGRWVEAILRHGAFSQQMNPWTGEFSDQGKNYSPAMLVLLEAVSRLHGIRRRHKRVEWGCTLPPGVTESFYSLSFHGTKAELHQSSSGATFLLNSSEIAHVRGSAQLITDLRGYPKEVVNFTAEPQHIVLTTPILGRRHYDLLPDEIIEIPFKDRP